MKPQQGPASPCSPVGMVSFLLLGSLAAPQHWFRQPRPQLPDHRPVWQWSGAHALTFLERTKHDRRNILMYNGSLLLLKRAWLCFPASKSNLAGFSPNGRETERRAIKMRKQQSPRDMESHWAVARAREAQLCTRIRRREKGNRYLKTWLCALKAIPLEHFLKAEVKIQTAAQVWVEAGWQCLWDADRKTGLRRSLQSRLSVKLRARNAFPFHIRGAEP